MKAEAAISRIDCLLAVKEYDAAFLLSLEADSLYREDGYTLPSVWVKEIPKLSSSYYQDSLLASLTDEEYGSLVSNTYNPRLSPDSSINAELVYILHSRKGDRAALKRAADRKARSEKAERELVEQQIRIASEQQIRNAFLDSNMDVKVTVKGKNKDHLYLEFVLFSDVWYRRFETEGIFDKYHALGFNKVTLSDGYDYNKYVYWK